MSARNPCPECGLVAPCSMCGAARLALTLVPPPDVRERMLVRATLDAVDRMLRADADYARMDPFPCVRTMDVDAILAAVP